MALEGEKDRPAAQRGLSRRSVVGTGIVLLLGYILIVGWPHLRATFVRDAAVTTWISITSTLVPGYVRDPLYPGARIGADGRIATIVDPRADATPLARAQAELARVRARALVQRNVVEVESEAFEARKARAEGFTATFIANLDAAIASTESNIAFLTQQLDLAQTEMTRKEILVRAGHGSQAAVDTSAHLVVEYQHLLNDLRTSKARMNERRAAARTGYFLLDDGTDMGHVLNTLDDAHSRLARAELELQSLEAEVQAGVHTVEAASLALERARESVISGPPGALVWSLISGPGAPVIPGAPVASWINCSVLMVDVPASDVEIALLNIGDTAHVILEGEGARRDGKVLLLRGSAAVIGGSDLAALAKGRTAGVGQVLLSLQAMPGDQAHCPVGHAAFVDFPGVHWYDVVRARLRF